MIPDDKRTSSKSGKPGNNQGQFEDVDVVRNPEYKTSKKRAFFLIHFMKFNNRAIIIQTIKAAIFIVY